MSGGMWPPNESAAAASASVAVATKAPAKFLFSLGKEAVGIRRKGAALLSGHVARPSCLRRGVRVIARVRLTSPLHVSGTCDGTANA